jgi:hypothetical protein
MEFIHQTCGKNYELNIKKLLSKKSIGDSPKK